MVRNLSIRGGRKEYAGRFEQAIAEFHALANLLELLRDDRQDDDVTADTTTPCTLSRWRTLPADVVALVLAYCRPGSAGLMRIISTPLRPPPLAIEGGSGRFVVCARKRPVWAIERADGEFDALTLDSRMGRCVLCGSNTRGTPSRCDAPLCAMISQTKVHDR